MSREDGGCAAPTCCAAPASSPSPTRPAGPAGDGDLEFVHPLIATAVYDSIPDGHAHRDARHRRPGRHRVRARAPRRPPATSSRSTPDDDQELVEQLREAAREHLAVGAPDAARRCLERALQEPPAPERPRARALRTGLRHPPHLARHHHRAPADRARRCPASTAPSASTPSSGSPRPCSTTTSWRRPSARSRRRPPGTNRARPGCGSRPCTSCGRASTPARTASPGRSQELAALAAHLHGPGQLRARPAHPARLRRHDPRRERRGGRRALRPRPRQRPPRAGTRLDRPRVGHRTAD